VALWCALIKKTESINALLPHLSSLLDKVQSQRHDQFDAIESLLQQHATDIIYLKDGISKNDKHDAIEKLLHQHAMDIEYLKQMQRLTIPFDNTGNKVICPSIYNGRRNGMSCFKGCDIASGISVDVEELVWHTEISMFIECLPAFLKLRRLKLWYLSTSTGHGNLQGFENLFVEELHLVSASDFDMKGIEKLPNLRKLIIENSKNIFLDHLFSIDHKINTIHAINTPCLNVYKDKFNLTIM